jgi:hypothetical protein
LTYSGTVYNDLNGNGVMNSGEPALTKWTINLLNSLGTVVSSVTTGGTGTYSFANLGPGKWTIQEVNQSGWYQTQPVNPPGIYSFAAVSGSNQTGLNYGNFQTITVSGSVYNDLNGDGKKQGNEPGLANWTVELLNTSGNVVSQVTTDSKGNYTIGQVFPGTFKLVEILQSGWVQTQPVSPPAYTISPVSGQNQSGLVFGVHKTTASSQTPTIGLSSIATQGTTSGPIAALGTSSNAAPSGPLNASPTTAPATTTAAPAAPTVSLIGTDSTPVRVVYSQGTQPVQYTPAAPLVDVALGVVSTRVRARQTVVTDQAIGAMAGALLGDDEGDAS